MMMCAGELSFQGDFGELLNSPALESVLRAAFPLRFTFAFAMRNEIVFGSNIN